MIPRVFDIPHFKCISMCLICIYHRISYPNSSSCATKRIDTSLKIEENVPETFFRFLTSGSYTTSFFSLSLFLIHSRSNIHLFLSCSCSLAWCLPFPLTSAWLMSRRATTRLGKCRRLSGISGTSSGILPPLPRARSRETSSAVGMPRRCGGGRRRREERVSHGKTFVHSRPTRS